jgi:murein DD-endopeptidase MepM/ murein hydrolase activator NlpD
MGSPDSKCLSSRAPRWRRQGVVVLAAVLAATLLPSGVSAQSETPAEKAAREIQEARDQANAAADAYFEAESELEGLEDELAGLELQETQLQATVDELRGEVELVALSRYVESGTEGIPLLTDVSEPQDRIQAEVYVDILTNVGADTLDLYDAAEKALVETQDDIAERRRDVEAKREEFGRLEGIALAEVDRLREIEAERLQDEAVQKALEARIAAERAAIEEQQRLEAEAAARAQPNPGLVVPTTTEPPASTVPDDAPPTTDADGNVVTAPETTTPETLPPETTIPQNAGGSGGTSGGRTGGGGGGNGPGAVDTGAGYIDSIICPMPGSAYGDTWGAPRSGGRRHEGVDMIAPRGLPIYAVVSGVVTFKSNRLGGNAVSLVGDNGNRYYYGHLDSYVGSSRRVFQGEMIGYNGDTGNAKFSTPHLHFQVHPGGGRPVNPYPTVRAAGC